MSPANTSRTFADDAICPACETPGLDIFFAETGIPTNSCLLLDTKAEAESFPVGDLTLGFCPRCGFLTNTVFEEAEYSQRYEETQGFSQVFVDWAKGLAQRWVEEHDLVGKKVVEIGCGKGEFLVWMVEAGAAEGIGIDPGVHPERIDSAVADKLTWIADFYTEQYGSLDADAVVCRHTLEHISPVADFMRTVRRAIGDRHETIVLFELPDVRRVLEEVAFWDVYHEHCSYFSLGSLARLFRATGFEVQKLETEYDDQYLLIEATPIPLGPNGEIVAGTADPLEMEHDLDVLARGVDKYHTEFAALTSSWQEKLSHASRPVIWGAGSKGVSFLTKLGADITYAVDINPFKTGKFMAGTGHEIVAPEFLTDYQPDLIIAMNSIYLEEIQADLDRLGVTADLIGV